MKSIKKSFLFFILFISFQLLGQKQIDSLTFYSEMVKNPSKEFDLVKPYLFFNKILNKPLNETSKINIIYALSYKSSIELKQGFNYESETNAIKGLDLIKKEKQTNYLRKIKTGLYNHLGILYRKQNFFIKSHELYNKALSFSNNLKDSITILNNIANVFKKENKYTKAKETLLKAYGKIGKNKYDKLLARVLDNLGVVKSKINKNDGEEEILLALKLRKKKGYLLGIQTSYNNLSEFYRRNLNLKKAKEYALKSLKIANETRNTLNRQKSLGLLTELSGNTYVMEYKKINDSIVKARQKNSNKFALLKYNTTKEKEKAKESELKREKAENSRILFQLLGLFVVVLSIITYFFYREKHKKKIVERVIETEGKISKTIHDVIANDIYHVMAKFQSESSTREELLDDLEKVYDSARDISRDNYIIEEHMNFEEIIYDLFMSYKNEKVGIVTKNLQKINWTKFSVQKKNMLYRVLKELMTNMRKYSEATLVTIGFEQKGKIHIKYKDNGVGAVVSKKNGLLNAENRIKSVGGSIIFNSEPGNGFIIKIMV